MEWYWTWEIFINIGINICKYKSLRNIVRSFKFYVIFRKLGNKSIGIVLWCRENDFFRLIAEVNGKSALCELDNSRYNIHIVCQYSYAVGCQNKNHTAKYGSKPFHDTKRLFGRFFVVYYSLIQLTCIRLFRIAVIARQLIQLCSELLNAVKITLVERFGCFLVKLWLNISVRFHCKLLVGVYLICKFFHWFSAPLHNKCLKKPYFFQSNLSLLYFHNFTYWFCSF